MSIASIIYAFVCAIVPILLAITLHEAAHGYVAYRLGDDTAKKLGRISANPFRHIDPFGTVIMPLVGFFLFNLPFGAAKPVPIETRHFEHPKVDVALVAAAGPISNWMMACFWALIIVVSLKIGATTGFGRFLYDMGQIGVAANLFIASLNLLPIPPLDGSKVLMGILPYSFARLFVRYERLGIFLLLGLIAIEIYSINYTESGQGILFDLLQSLVKPFMQIIESVFNIKGIYF